MAEIESIVEPYSITNDIRWESVTLVSIHPEIIFHRELTCQYRLVTRLLNIPNMIDHRLDCRISIRRVNY